MFLQATVDAPDYAVARELLRVYEKVPEIDVVEMGAPMVTHYGVEGYHWFKRYCAKDIYVDTKTIDFPRLELMPYIKAGARRFSAMAVMNTEAFEQLAAMQTLYDLPPVLVSLMGYPLDRVNARVTTLMDLGFDHFIAHGAGSTPESAFADMCAYLNELSAHPLNSHGLKVVAAGGISPVNVSGLSGLSLAGVIVGRGIAVDTEPQKAAQSIVNSLSARALGSA